MTSVTGSQWEQKLAQYQQAGAATEPEVTCIPDPLLPLVTVVLVTDNPSHRQQLQALASAHAGVMQCLIYPSLGQAQQACMPDLPRLLIIDAVLLHTCEAMLEPFIVCGYSNQDAMLAFTARAEGFITMPVDITQFDDTLSYVAGLVLQQQQRHTYQTLRTVLAKQYGVSAQQFPHWLKQHSRERDIPRVTFRSSNAWITMACRDILWVQAAGDYMCVYTQGENHIVRTTLADLSRKLCPDIFERVNRSVLVNRHFVKQVERQGPQSAFVVLQDDTRLKISRRYFTAHWQHII